MKIIPVLDVLNGVAVHAVRGERSRYKPLKSVLCDSTDPLDVAKAFAGLGFKELYVADLNAITGNGENSHITERIVEKTGLKLMVDAGVADIERAQTVLRHGASEVIIGTETLTDATFVEQAVHMLGSQNVVVSLDMKNGQILTKLNVEQLPDPVDLLREFKESGLTQVILLDLGRVGSGEGLDWDFLRTVMQSVRLRVFVGGGVCDIADLVKLNELRVGGALVATSLHSGKITIGQILGAGLGF